MEKNCNKITFKDRKWSSLNDPGSETPVSHSTSEEFNFPIYIQCLNGDPRREQPFSQENQQTYRYPSRNKEMGGWEKKLEII